MLMKNVSLVFSKKQMVMIFCSNKVPELHKVYNKIKCSKPNASAERTKLEQVLIASQFQRELLEGHHPLNKRKQGIAIKTKN